MRIANLVYIGKGAGGWVNQGSGRWNLARSFAQLWIAEVSGRMKLKLGELRVSVVYFD